MLDRHTDTTALRRILAERHLTQDRFGQLVQLSHDMVSRVIRHERDLSYSAAFRISTTLGIDLDTFTHPGQRSDCATCQPAKRAAA